MLSLLFISFKAEVPNLFATKTGDIQDKFSMYWWRWGGGGLSCAYQKTTNKSAIVKKKEKQMFLFFLCSLIPNGIQPFIGRWPGGWGPLF